MIPASNSTACTTDVPADSQQPRGRCEYVAARRALKAALAQGGLRQAESLDIPKALDRLSQSFDLLVVEPMLKEATEAVNSMSRALLIAAVDVIERLHESSPLVQAGKGRGLYRRDVRMQDVSEKALETRMKQIDQLIAILRELTKKR